MSNALTQIPSYYPTEFTTNWTHKVQQMTSKLRDLVTFDTVNGKEKVTQRIGTVTFQRITERAGSTRITDLNLEKRWLRIAPYDDAKLFDEWDDEFLGQIVLPTSPLIESQSRAYARLCDSVIITAAIGDAITGVDGTTLTPLPSGQQVAVDYVETGSTANSGLTIAKMRAAKYILDNNDVDDMEQRTLVVTARQLQNLLRTTEVTSHDYNDVKALVDGKVDTFLGFYIKRVSSTIVPKTGNIRSLPFFVKSGVRFADTGKQTLMDIIPTQSHSVQIRTKGAVGAVRDEEEKAGVIFCDETVL
ncbi:hypothetical protein TSACC_21704 [Terrimicrobium sacchariphilum]|uniref:Phage major capsid protein E n=1 Tax=Terrimicrobium sacchariphilum TaxID=690879 RepID=A0A146G713_TERSA|nr:phage capsid protein [Terrimicrobium sacchariphilum]GAT33291.1 hypothetical protein TSACC_21704 [Terrimicrobium sacchariphilum]